jgi:hypothetical protein
MTFDPTIHLTGWIDSPDRHALAATFAPPLAQAAPHLMYGAGEDVFLFRAWKDVLGSYPAYVAQQIGDCTSFGSGHAIDLLQCVEASIGKEPISYLETCTEAIYGMGREIAGMLGGGDGCYGVAVAKALVTMGAVPRKLVGAYSGNRAKEWGGRGVPESVKTAAAQFKLGSAALVTTLDELDAALANGYPAAGGFSQGFTMHRDQDGCCRQSGRWGHEQCCAGRRTRNGRRQYLLCQSWGANVPDGPTTDDQPDFSFWIDQDPMASILDDVPRAETPPPIEVKFNPDAATRDDIRGLAEQITGALKPLDARLVAVEKKADDLARDVTALKLWAETPPKTEAAPAPPKAPTLWELYDNTGVRCTGYDPDELMSRVCRRNEYFARQAAQAVTYTSAPLFGGFYGGGFAAGGGCAGGSCR